MNWRNATISVQSSVSASVEITVWPRVSSSSICATSNHFQDATLKNVLRNIASVIGKKAFLKINVDQLCVVGEWFSDSTYNTCCGRWGQDITQTEWTVWPTKLDKVDWMDAAGFTGVGHALWCVLRTEGAPSRDLWGPVKWLISDKQS